MRLSDGKTNSEAADAYERSSGGFSPLPALARTYVRSKFRPPYRRSDIAEDDVGDGSDEAGLVFHRLLLILLHV